MSSGAYISTLYRHAGGTFRTHRADFHLPFVFASPAFSHETPLSMDFEGVS